MTTQNVRDTSFNDLIDLLCTPQLTLCISLATKKMFSGYIAYAKTLGDTDKGKDTFLKRICAWQTQCDGPNIHQSMMETRPKIIRKLFSDWNMKGKQSRGADHLHKKLLKLVSKLFLGCSNKVGKNTSEEMKKWFELMSAKQMFGDANSLKTEFEDKTRNVGGEEEELVYFDYRAVFLYTAHLVTLSGSNHITTLQSPTLVGGGMLMMWIQMMKMENIFPIKTICYTLFQIDILKRWITV